MQNFVYLIGDPVARECVVVDPAWEIDTIVETAERDGMALLRPLWSPTRIRTTWAAASSPGACPGASRAWRSCSAACPSRCTSTRPSANFSRDFGSDLVKVDGHDTLAVGRLTLTFLHTPGHTPGIPVLSRRRTAGIG